MKKIFKGVMKKIFKGVMKKIFKGVMKKIFKGVMKNLQRCNEKSSKVYFGDFFLRTEFKYYE